MCTAEKNMLKSQGLERQRHRNRFKEKRKLFDKEVQGAKRKYWKQQQTELGNITDCNQRDFWKKIGKVDIGQERNKMIPKEIVLEDGSLSANADIVLEKWRDSFCELLNPVTFVPKNSRVNSITSFSLQK